VVLVIQHAKRMRCIILSSAACLTLPYVSTLPYKRTDCREKVTEHKACVLIFSSNFSETFLILRRLERYIIIHAQKSSCKIPVHSCQILIKLNFSRQIFEKSSNITLHENPSTRSRVVPYGRTDGRKDTDTQT
jgi:hypothetical protein